MEESQNTTANWIVAGIGAATILVGGWWVITHNARSSGETATSTPVSTTTKASGGRESGVQLPNLPDAASKIIAEEDAVLVADQLTGESVSVMSVTLSKPGWVAIRDERGWTLGAGWFDAGTHANVSVPLLRATEAGQRYQALLYIDTLGDHTFDLHGETLVTNPDGSVAGTTFVTK